MAFLENVKINSAFNKTRNKARLNKNSLSGNIDKQFGQKTYFCRNVKFQVKSCNLVQKFKFWSKI